MKHFGDITKLSGYELPVVDIITGGSPCQDLSIAGKRAGLAGERSGLFMEQMRIIREMREKDARDTGRTGWAIRPRYMVWENVPGAFSSGKPKGADFAAVIEEIIKVAEPNSNVCVCVYQSEDGQKPGATTLRMVNGALLGEFTTHSFGESPREENASRLSQILEDCPHQKYSLSAKACQGILNRAERRGKELPPELKAALEAQSVSKSEPGNLGGQRTAPAT